MNLKRQRARFFRISRKSSKWPLATNVSVEPLDNSWTMLLFCYWNSALNSKSPRRHNIETMKWRMAFVIYCDYPYRCHIRWLIACAHFKYVRMDREPFDCTINSFLKCTRTLDVRYYNRWLPRVASAIKPIGSRTHAISFRLDCFRNWINISWRRRMQINFPFICYHFFRIRSFE